MSAYETVHAHMVRLQRKEAGQNANEIADALGKVLEVCTLGLVVSRSARHNQDCDPLARGGSCRCGLYALQDALQDAVPAATEDNGP